MTVRRTLFAASVAALLSTAACALPSQASSGHASGRPPSTTPVGPPSTSPTDIDSRARRPAAAEVRRQAADPGQRGNSHKCKANKVAYVVSGTLAGQTLSKNPDGTYSGGLTVDVTHTNHPAAGDKGASNRAYVLTDVRVTFGLPDAQHHASVGLEDLKNGDRVMLIGKITRLAKRCPPSTTPAQPTIQRVVFHAL
jgi:hypothetical protein